MPEQTQIQDAWTAISPAYDQHVTPSHVGLAERALQRAGLRRGMEMLDVAAGSGAMSIPAARAGASVLATDISSGMVERLEVRAREEGLSNLEARVMDGHALELEDDTVDIAGSQFGVMLFPDLPKGLREMARVTRPGGRVLVVTLGPPSEVEFLSVFLEAVGSAVPGFTGLPMDPPPLPFQAADPERLREELADAGLSELDVETVTHRLAFSSGSELWDWVVASNPIGAEMVADLSESQKAAAQQALDDVLRERAGDSPHGTLHNTVHIAVGTK